MTTVIPLSPKLSARFVLRTARPEDALAVAEIHVRAWQVGYRGLLPDDCLDKLRPEDRARRYTFGDSDPAKPATIVASIADKICGFATISPARDPDMKGRGELSGLYVDPDLWGRGIGAVLLAEAQVRLHAQGFKEAILWVLEGNARAEHFYEHRGWRVQEARRSEEVWGVIAKEIRYVRPLP